MKQINLRPNIASNDLNTKIRQIRKFLEKQLIVKVTLDFKGRELTNVDKGFEVLQQVSTQVSDLGKVTLNDKVKGAQILMTIQPFKKTA